MFRPSTAGGHGCPSVCVCVSVSEDEEFTRNIKITNKLNVVIAGGPHVRNNDVTRKRRETLFFVEFNKSDAAELDAYIATYCAPG